MQNIAEKTVIVTGSNKGIGWWIIASIMKQKLPYKIIMCSRSQENGDLAISELMKEPWGAAYADRITCGILDLTSNESINAFKTWFSATHSKADIIVNNAGFAYKGSTFNSTVLKETFDTNYDGTIYFQSQMEELINLNGKVIYIGSGAGPMTLNRLSESLQARFTDPKLGPDGLMALKMEMLGDLDAEKFEERGWTNWGYGLSKMFLIRYVLWQGQQKYYQDNNIQVNHFFFKVKGLFNVPRLVQD
jgi:carbonyl reductase 1